MGVPGRVPGSLEGLLSALSLEGSTHMQIPRWVLSFSPWQVRGLYVSMWLGDTVQEESRSHLSSHRELAGKAPADSRWEGWASRFSSMSAGLAVCALGWRVPVISIADSGMSLLCPLHLWLQPHRPHPMPLRAAPLLLGQLDSRASCFCHPRSALCL